MIINKKIAISESGFVFDSSTGDSYTLNPVALDIINMIKNEFNIEQIKHKMLQEYEVTSDVLEKTLDEFLITLKDHRVILD